METNQTTLKDQEAKPENKDSFWGRYGPQVLLGVLVVYVILLGIGTYAELTHNEAILNWWIFK